MTMRILALAVLAASVAACGDESSITNVGDVPYHVELRLVDPLTGDPLPVSGGSTDWPLGLPDGPVAEITYSADRITPAVPLTVRVTGAGLVQAEVDPFAEEGGGDVDQAVVEIPLALVDEQARTVRVDLVPPTRPGRAVLTAVLGGVSASVGIDFDLTDVVLELAAGGGVADGATEVPVTVRGAPRQVVELETSLGSFVAPGFTTTASLVLQPDPDDETAGLAQVGLVSDTEGAAVVSVVGAATTWARVDFAEVRLVIGSPAAVAFEPGRLIHDVCVVLNTARGTVGLANTSADAEVLDGDAVPVLDADGAPPPDCPAGDFAGYAVFRWAADGTTDNLTADWTGPDGAGTATVSRRVTGAVFAGYDGALDSTALDAGDPFLLLLEAELTYRAAGGLAAQPAANVPLEFLVVGAADPEEVFADTRTSADGRASAVYSVAAGDELQVFVQPDGWSSIRLGSAP
ncbi:MAG: hypothetical protein JXB32_11265 [Deltaproteobacteria bacterium]|nr:hypothetical protein [Deltaproteobacteria bacterium]